MPRLLLLVVILLASCGGGGDSGEDVSRPDPEIGLPYPDNQGPWHDCYFITPPKLDAKFCYDYYWEVVK